MIIKIRCRPESRTPIADSTTRFRLDPGANFHPTLEGFNVDVPADDNDFHELLLAVAKTGAPAILDFPGLPAQPPTQAACLHGDWREVFVYRGAILIHLGRGSDPTTAAHTARIADEFKIMRTKVEHILEEAK